jgi:transcriptional regulator with XRE-family HTH domain
MAPADPVKIGASGTYGPSRRLSQRLRTARMARALSLRQLASRVGVSASLISQIETGKVQPSVNTLYAVASELGLSIDDLLGSSGDRRAAGPGCGELEDLAAVVQQADDRKVIRLNERVRWERLTKHAEPGIDFLCIVYEPGGESGAVGVLHRHSGREWGHVVRGTLSIEVGDEEYTLGPGDSIMFDSTTPHRLCNPGTEEMHAIWFVLGRHGDTRLHGGRGEPDRSSL